MYTDAQSPILLNTPSDTDSILQPMLVMHSIADGVELGVMLIVLWQVLPLRMLAQTFWTRQSTTVAVAMNVEVRCF